MSKRIFTRMVAVPLALALAAPVLAPATPAFAYDTAVTIHMAETGGNQQKPDSGHYDKTGGIGIAPVIAVLGASSAGCLALAHHLGRGGRDDGEEEEQA